MCGEAWPPTLQSRAHDDGRDVCFSAPQSREALGEAPLAWDCFESSHPISQAIEYNPVPDDDDTCLARMRPPCRVTLQRPDWLMKWYIYFEKMRLHHAFENEKWILSHLHSHSMFFLIFTYFSIPVFPGWDGLQGDSPTEDEPDGAARATKDLNKSILIFTRKTV